MSKIAKKPILIPSEIKLEVFKNFISIKNGKRELKFTLNKYVGARIIEGKLDFFVKSSRYGWKLAGTTRALLNNLIIGIKHGFTKKLQLVGIGYRASIEANNILNLSLGFSHAIYYKVPEDINVKCPNQNEIHIIGSDKQKVGQVAAEIRAYRPPEPYKGKGIRYFNEKVKIKESKKK